MIIYHHGLILFICIFMYVYIVKTDAILNYVYHKFTFKLKIWFKSVITTLFIIYLAKGIDYLIYHIQITFIE
jgi:hypothetical protein